METSPTAAPRPLPSRADLALALAVALAALALALVQVRWRPFQPQGVHDEVAYLFQAETLLRGRLGLPPPAHGEFFEVPQVLVEPRYLAKYWPGHAAVLAPFVALGAPWL